MHKTRNILLTSKFCYRIQYVKKLLSRRKKEVKYLQERLDAHGDDWRNAPAETDVKQDAKPNIQNAQTSNATVKSGKGVLFIMICIRK